MMMMLIAVLMMAVVVVATTAANKEVDVDVTGETSTTTTSSSSSSSCNTQLQHLLHMNQQRPYVTTNIWLPSTISNFSTISVTNIQSNMAMNNSSSYCSSTTTTTGSTASTPNVQYETVTIGQMPQMTTSQAMEVLNTAVTSWDRGQGIWTTQYTTIQRIETIYKVLEEMSNTTGTSNTLRNELIQILQWEIGKNYIDAAAEIDRTILFAKQIMNYIVTNPTTTTQQFQSFSTPTDSDPSSSESSYSIVTKRSAIGVALVLAPYNYPINECYATFIPALLLGNVVIVKIPSVGGLVHLRMMSIWAKYLPHGTLNFISGPGAVILPSIMESGQIDVLSVIGSSKSADQLIQYHPQPNRLKLFLQLGAKNMGIVLPDVFTGVTESDNTILFQNTITESILGSLSYNGQRCTALKIFFVPKQFADLFVSQLSKAVESLTIGLPWQNHTTNSLSTVQYSQITPLPNHSRIQFLTTRIDDAVKKGATIMNQKGGTILGGPSSTLMIPAVLYPITSTMKLYTDEQFGPIIPIVPYDTIEEVIEYANHRSEFAQQVSIFGQDTTIITSLVDTISSMIPKINFNSQCARSPDVLPFAARRSSGIGVMSVSDVLEEFSLPTVIAYQNQHLNDPIAKELFKQSKFLGAVKDS